MQAVVSTIVRGAPRGEDGYVYVVDVERRRLLHCFQPPTALNPDLGPRGAARGYRGITFVGDDCVIANNDSLFFYDRDWNLVRHVTHEWFCDIHEIAADDDGIWVVSTGLDAVLKVQGDGDIVEKYFLGELPEETRKRIHAGERHIDRLVDQRHRLYPTDERVTQVNSVCLYRGEPYVTLYNQGIVMRLRDQAVLFEDPTFFGCHSARIVDQHTIYVAHSYARALAIVSLPSQRVVSTVSVLPPERQDPSRLRRALQNATTHPLVRQSPVTKAFIRYRPNEARWLAQHLPASARPTQVALPGWARGIDIADDGRVLVGTSPAGFAIIDPASESPTDFVALSDDLANAVSAIAIDRRKR